VGVVGDKYFPLDDTSLLSDFWLYIDGRGGRHQLIARDAHCVVMAIVRGLGRNQSSANNSKPIGLRSPWRIVGIFGASSKESPVSIENPPDFDRDRGLFKAADS
jgi:hypothetical protein